MIITPSGPSSAASPGSQQEPERHAVEEHVREAVRAATDRRKIGRPAGTQRVAGVEDRDLVGALRRFGKL